jgi:hypothetical protein
MSYKFTNYCKPDSEKLLGIKGAFDDEADGELLPCPICGRVPVPEVHTNASNDYTACVSCFAGGFSSHAYVKVSGQKNYPDALEKAVSKWNRGKIDYFDQLSNVFRSCYTCRKFVRQNGCPTGACTQGFMEKPFRGCKDGYERMSAEEFAGKLTR